MLDVVSTQDQSRPIRINLLAYALATSLAPLPNAEKTKAMDVIARIQSYLAVIAGAIFWMKAAKWYG
jgi:hypothetical protein